MIRKVASVVLVMMLVFGSYANIQAEAQTASPSTATITVSGVPTGTNSLAVEVTVDSSVLTLSSASSDVSGSLAVTGAEGVGIVSTSGDLPASFTVTVNLGGVAAGTSMVTVGMVLDMIGGTEIAGASASSDVSSVTVSGSGSTSSTSSTSSSSTSGVPGNLDNDTLTVTITGDAVNTANALNVTIAFGDSSIAQLASANPTFMGTGATQLLTAADSATGVLTAVWDGTVTDNAVTLTAMLAAGAMAGTTSIGVAKVEAAGGVDITGSVVAQVSPESVTNGAAVAGDCGSFALLAPTSVTGPGEAAVGFSVSNAGSGLSGTLNGSMVDFSGDGAGVAIVDLPSSGDLDLSLSVSCVGASDTIALGSIMVNAGDGGKAPTVRRATAKNKSAKTTLTVFGKKLKGASFDIVPTDKTATAEKVGGKRIKATFDPAECIPDGSFVNVSTPSGTDAKAIKVMGACSN
ncbi:MAG: hypothetical protein HYR97_05600 [Candidatus Melainabacteria bacterium]|nr:hypothetical protein [Candidatus Melainabacteria bacterium]